MNIKALITVLLIALTIPAIGFGISSWVLSDINNDLAKNNLPDIVTICSTVKSGEYNAEFSNQMNEICSELSSPILLSQGSFLAGVIGTCIPVVYVLASFIVGTSRKRIALVFPILLRVSVLLIALLVLLQGVILTYSVYLGESYAIGRVHFILILGIGLGALIGGFKLIGASLSFGNKMEMGVAGKVLTKESSPKLFAFVENIAKNLNALMPTNIIVGLEPTFYVTNTDISIVGTDDTISGETLYISSALARLFTNEELASVIGHELGHFRGDDTVYSMKFAPIYAGLGKAIHALSSNEEEGTTLIAKLPALATLSFMHNVFSMNENKIGRDRELKADLAGVEAGSAMALSTALIKLTVYSDLWAHSQEDNVNRLNAGKVSDNLSLIFQDSAKFDIENSTIENILSSSLEETVTHPTDTHPTIATRLNEMNISPSDISLDTLGVPVEPSINIIDNYKDVEEEITVLEHKLMVAYGYAHPPEEAEENHILDATYILAAAMVCADGTVDPDEITVAEGIGQKMFSDFDSVEFRNRCNNPDGLPDISKLAQTISTVLEDKHKNLLIDYLRAISEADNDVSIEEKELLDSVISAF